MFLFQVFLYLFIYQRCNGNHLFHKNKPFGFPTAQEISALDFDYPPWLQPSLGDDGVTDEEPTTPDDHPVTDEEPTSTTEDNPVTEKEDCPAGKSLHSKNDVKVIIDFVFNNLKLKESFMDKLVKDAERVKDVHAKEVAVFTDWFSDRPEHLLHILQSLAAIREQKLEPEANKIADILKGYPDIKKLIDDKQLKTNKLKKKMDRNEQLCKINCIPDPEPNRIFKRSVPEEYVCSSIADLHSEITSKLKQEYDAFLQKKLDHISGMDNKFAEEINNVKIELKDRALNEYGRTFYDVLELEDKYHHLSVDMNSTKVQGDMYSVKEVGLEIDSKLLQFERTIEQYGKYCKHCKSELLRRLVRQTNEQKHVMQNVKDSNPIVDDLIKDKWNESDVETNEVISEIFKDINDFINNPGVKDNLFEKLKSKQKEIGDTTNVERQGLEQLKKIAPEESLKSLSELISVSQDLLKTINEHIAHLDDIMPH